MSIFDEDYLPIVKEQYPELKEGWQITMVANSIDLLTGSPTEVRTRTNELQFEQNLFADDALELSVEESTQRVESAEGCVFVRAEKSGKVPLLLAVRLPS